MLAQPPPRTHAHDADAIRITVLLVEDDPSYQMVLREALRGAGHTVKLVGTVQTMIAYLTAARSSRLPHLVILDWFLPRERDGQEALAWIRSHRDRRVQVLPVLVLTAARQQAQVRRQALDSGATECLSKVTRLDEIAHTAVRLARMVDDASPSLHAATEACPLILAGHQALRADQGNRIALTPNQAALLYILLEQAGDVVPYSTLESRLFPLHTERHGLLRRHVYRLNQRLKCLGVRVRSSRRDAGYYLSWD